MINTTIKEKYDHVSIWVFLTIAFATVGAMLGVPYCFLAGWSSDNITTIISVAPFFVAGWLYLAILAEAINENPQKKLRFDFNWKALISVQESETSSYERRKFYLVGFWIWTFVIFLPVIVHWIALGVLVLGFQQQGMYLEIHRYQSQTAFFLVAIVVAVLVIVGKEIVSILKR